MHVALADAGNRLTDLVARAEAGEDVVLTRDGRAAVRLTPVAAQPEHVELRRLLDNLTEAGRKVAPGPSAARSQDFLYDEFGLPA